jgi:hypothetical protein
MAGMKLSKTVIAITNRKEIHRTEVFAVTGLVK